MRPLLVLGLGDPARGDDGVGPAAIRVLSIAGDLPPRVALVEGGAGAAAPPAAEEAWRAILVASIDLGAPAGTVFRFSGDDVAGVLLQGRASRDAHVADVLALCSPRRDGPEEVALWAIQPGDAGAGPLLSPEVEAGLPRLIAGVRAEIRRIAGCTPPRGPLLGEAA